MFLSCSQKSDKWQFFEVFGLWYFTWHQKFSLSHIFLYNLSLDKIYFLWYDKKSIAKKNYDYYWIILATKKLGKPAWDTLSCCWAMEVLEFSTFTRSVNINKVKNKKHQLFLWNTYRFNLSGQRLCSEKDAVLFMEHFWKLGWYI